MRKVGILVGVFVAILGTNLLFAGAGVELKKFVPAQEYYREALQAFDEKDWDSVLYFSHLLSLDYPSSAFTRDLLYNEGVAYFELGDYHFANLRFSEYLGQKSSPKFFEEALHYKFVIAENYRQGKRKKVLGLSKMPKWETAREDALQIYDEVISSLPLREEAARSLFGKAQILTCFKEYRTAIEVLQQLARRFPKHELAMDAYLEIAKIYTLQSNPRQQDPDLIDLAEINLKKFQEAFPKEDKKIEEAKVALFELKERFARSLYEVGKFYERMKKPKAAKIYYSKIMKSFPMTESAKLSQRALVELAPKLSEQVAKNTEVN